MENAFTPKDYLKKLTERIKVSRVRTPYQHAGLIISAILDDPAHKSLYMKLAKLYNSTELITLAKSVSQRKNIQNKGGYFMRIITERLKEEKPEKKNNENSNHPEPRKRKVSAHTSKRNPNQRGKSKKPARPRQRNAKNNE